MTKEEGNNRNVYIFDRDYGVIPISVYGESYQMRYGFTHPVINLYKSAIDG